MSDVIDVAQALEHPQTIPFLGGRARAEQYLQRHKEVKGNRIGIWHSADLADEPLVVCCSLATIATMLSLVSISLTPTVVSRGTWCERSEHGAVARTHAKNQLFKGLHSRLSNKPWQLLMIRFKPGRQDKSRI